MAADGSFPPLFLSGHLLVVIFFFFQVWSRYVSSERSEKEEALYAHGSRKQARVEGEGGCHRFQRHMTDRFWGSFPIEAGARIRGNTAARRKPPGRNEYCIVNTENSF